MRLSWNLSGENTGKAIKVSGGKLKFDLDKYAPASFILESGFNSVALGS
jgi:hypothetical protein